MSNVIPFPLPHRGLDTTLDAAVEWLCSELDDGEPVTMARLRELAEREAKRPRDAVHARWSAAFLEEAKSYG